MKNLDCYIDRNRLYRAARAAKSDFAHPVKGQMNSLVGCNGAGWGGLAQ